MAIGCLRTVPSGRYAWTSNRCAPKRMATSAATNAAWLADSDPSMAAMTVDLPAAGPEFRAGGGAPSGAKRTGHGACLRTRPTVDALSPRRPRDPTAMNSASSWRASRTISSLGAGPLGEVVEGRVHVWFRPVWEDYLGLPDSLDQAPVELIRLAADPSETLLRAAIESLPSGIVIVEA
jgi:hypothetical protein